jgi:hypothetical protein
VTAAVALRTSAANLQAPKLLEGAHVVGDIVGNVNDSFGLFCTVEFFCYAITASVVDKPGYL